MRPRFDGVYLDATAHGLRLRQLVTATGYQLSCMYASGHRAADTPLRQIVLMHDRECLPTMCCCSGSLASWAATPRKSQLTASQSMASCDRAGTADGQAIPCRKWPRLCSAPSTLNLSAGLRLFLPGDDRYWRRLSRSICGCCAAESSKAEALLSLHRIRYGTRNSREFLGVHRRPTPMSILTA